jgi:hypothetical protein
MSGEQKLLRAYLMIMKVQALFFIYGVWSLLIWQGSGMTMAVAAFGYFYAMHAHDRLAERIRER